MIPSKSLTLVTLLALAGCAGSTTVAQGPSAASDSSEAAGAAGAAAVTADTGGGADAAPASSALGVSAAQADRGRNVFRAVCTACHNSSEFSNRQFKFKWRRRTAGDLFETVSGQMPEDAPGSLELQEYADIVAFVLRMNGFEPGGAELPPDAAALETISLASFVN